MRILTINMWKISFFKYLYLNPFPLSPAKERNTRKVNTIITHFVFGKCEGWWWAGDSSMRSGVKELFSL